MNFTQMQHIPLASAYLCPDCNCIGNCASQCPACASPVLMALANVLDRKPEREAVAYPSIVYRSARRRAFLVPVGPRAVRFIQDLRRRRSQSRPALALMHRGEWFSTTSTMALSEWAKALPVRQIRRLLRALPKTNIPFVDRIREESAQNSLVHTVKQQIHREKSSRGVDSRSSLAPFRNRGCSTIYNQGWMVAS